MIIELATRGDSLSPKLYFEIRLFCHQIFLLDIQTLES
jgi:hypothetical protein